MSKELYIAAHEELIERYLETHEGVTWEQAYDLCADRAYDHMVDKLADRADHLRKARRGAPPRSVSKFIAECDHADNVRKSLRTEQREEGDTCGDCGVGAGEHAADCPRIIAEQFSHD